MQRWTSNLTQTVKRNGSTFRVRVVGAERSDGTWEGRLEFRDGKSEPICTDEETSQPNREALEYWSTGLEAIYLEGALERALENRRR